jgi:hypothetical protein
LAKPRSRDDSGSVIVAGGGAGLSGVLKVVRAGVALGCSLRFGPLGELGLGLLGGFGSVYLDSSVVLRWIRLSPALDARGVIVFAGDLSDSGVSTSITLPAFLKVLMGGEWG